MMVLKLEVALVLCGPPKHQFTCESLSIPHRETTIQVAELTSRKAVLPERRQLTPAPARADKQDEPAQTLFNQLPEKDAFHFKC